MEKSQDKSLQRQALRFIGGISTAVDARVLPLFLMELSQWTSPSGSEWTSPYEYRFFKAIRAVALLFGTNMPFKACLCGSERTRAEHSQRSENSELMKFLNQGFLRRRLAWVRKLLSTKGDSPQLPLFRLRVLARMEKPLDLVFYKRDLSTSLEIREGFWLGA